MGTKKKFTLKLLVVGTLLDRKEILYTDENVKEIEKLVDIFFSKNNYGEKDFIAFNAIYIEFEYWYNSLIRRKKITHLKSNIDGKNAHSPKMGS